MELPSEIVEQFLYLGAERHARNLDVLQSLGITHILNVSTEVPNYFATHEEGRPSITYLKCSLMDNDSENIHERFEEAFEFIEQARANDGKVLVHCHLGVSRSPSFVLYYLMRAKHHGMSLKDAFDLVRTKRQIASPRNAFIHQLIRCEAELFGKTTLNKSDYPVYRDEPKIFKTLVLFDVKPASNKVSPAELERAVRTIQMQGLTWTKSKFEDIGYGLTKLQIACVIQDDSGINVDDIQEAIEALERDPANMANTAAQEDEDSTNAHEQEEDVEEDEEEGRYLVQSVDIVMMDNAS
eukprot:GEZU01023486.1.p1 GENE.GEZU01023486.1~~GEZU01023486.1.p1  ORF type:complete len:297 (-),score=72.92 GEZU01023486.1:57-947(-)